MDFVFREFQKALTVCFIFSFIAFCVFLFFQGYWNSTHFFPSLDGFNHLTRFLSGQDVPFFEQIYFALAHLVSTNEFSFFLFNLFLAGFLLPILLFFYVKSWQIVLFYFLTINFFWYSMVVGTFPSILAFCFFMIFLTFDDFFVRFFAFLFGVFSHSMGFSLLFFAFLLVLFDKGFFKFVKFYPFFGFLKDCSVIPSISDGVISRPALYSLKNSFVFAASFSDFFVLFLRILPFPLFPLAFFNLLLLEKFDWLIFSVVLFFVGLFSHPLLVQRFWLFLSFPFLIGLTLFYVKNKQFKWWILLACLVFFALNFYNFLDRISFTFCNS